jgi:NAD(P)-dependent dehydrogenase (short-subunit alcohol dehydrogenase family)
VIASQHKAPAKAQSGCVAYELASQGIRVNSVMPGPTQTNLGVKFEPLRDAEGNVLPREVVVAEWNREIPTGRYGERR